MSHVHIVYAHPSERSFTHAVLEAFLRGLDEAGHTHTVSDLYAMGFRPELTREEYDRETGHDPDARVGADVRAEQERLETADVWAFIYPVWWTDCPALLKGWFDRVWTAGYAYEPTRLRPARKALVLCTAGYGIAELESSGCYQAMRTVMLTDRIGERARDSEFVLLGGSVSSGGDPAASPERRAELRAENLRRAAEIARTIEEFPPQNSRPG